jgi:transcriptional regulator of arginine metabolism
MRGPRLAAIRDVVAHEAIRSQEQLRRRLATRGFRVTQATLSRDIKELALVKRAADGAYQPAAADQASPTMAAHALTRAVSEYLESAEAVQQLVVLHTGAGQAQLLGVALDRLRLPGVAGTVAGDDTILVIAREPQSAQALARRLNLLAGGRQGRLGD